MSCREVRDPGLPVQGREYSGSVAAGGPGEVEREHSGRAYGERSGRAYDERSEKQEEETLQDSPPPREAGRVGLGARKESPVSTPWQPPAEGGRPRTGQAQASTRATQGVRLEPLVRGQAAPSGGSLSWGVPPSRSPRLGP